MALHMPGGAGLGEWWQLFFARCGEVGERVPARPPGGVDPQDENVKSAGSDEDHPSRLLFLLPLSTPVTNPTELQLLVFPRVNPGQGIQRYLKKRRNY